MEWSPSRTTRTSSGVTNAAVSAGFPQTKANGSSTSFKDTWAWKITRKRRRNRRTAALHPAQSFSGPGVNRRGRPPETQTDTRGTAARNVPPTGEYPHGISQVPKNQLLTGSDRHGPGLVGRRLHLYFSHTKRTRGFQGMKWGADLHSFPGMKLLAEGRRRPLLPEREGLDESRRRRRDQNHLRVP